MFEKIGNFSGFKHRMYTSEEDFQKALQLSSMFSAFFFISLEWSMALDLSLKDSVPSSASWLIFVSSSLVTVKKSIAMRRLFRKS